MRMFVVTIAKHPRGTSVVPRMAERLKSPLVRNFGLHNLAREFVDNRAANTLLTVVFLVFCVLEFGSLAVLSAEQSSPDANITNASSALWWTYVTITTVGYGDRYPVTNLGRLVGIFVMTAGVGLFGTLSGFLANTFLTPPKEKEEPAAAQTGASDPKARIARRSSACWKRRGRPRLISGRSWRR